MPEMTREEVASWDEADPLRAFRDEFHLPEGVLYLDGNSLGALPKKTAPRLQQIVAEEWGQGLIRSWNAHDWIRYPRRVGDRIAKILGAAPGQVVAADSTSVNLFKLLGAAAGLRPGRAVILSEEENFPTDLYVAQGFAALLGSARLELVRRPDLLGAIDEDVAVVTLTHVDFRTGEIHDMRELTRLCHDRGAMVIWDLSHSAGAVPLHLDRDDVDFAIGCGYKYLNGGPGAPAYLYVAERHQAAIRPPLSGWMGHEAPFAFDTDYRPAPGIERHLCGTPAILAMAALEVGVEITTRADIEQLREKSRSMGDLFLRLVAERCQGLGLTPACPGDSAKRGSQVSLRHAEGYPIMQALIAENVIGDFRAPDVLRFGFTPLYLRYVDVWDAVMILKRILESGAFRRPEFQTRQLVT
ncbi:MAG TPA: kynureninase [Vicinamibacteria bacterium]|nr:kynureninase [Vicinamibacteria bacterium]